MEARLLIPAFILAALAVVAGVYAKLKAAQGTLNVRAVIFFSLLTILVFGLASLLTLWQTTPLLNIYIIIELLALAVGIGVAASIYSNAQENQFWADLLFVTFLTLLAAFAVDVVWTFIGPRPGLANFMASATVPLLVPYLGHKGYLLMQAIPDEEFAKWYLPTSSPAARLEDYANSTPVLISVQIAPSASDARLDTFELYAPEDMRWGECFYSVMLEYNLNKPYPAELEDAYGHPYAYNFYVKRGLFKSKHYLNPAITVRENKLTKSETIVAERLS